MTTHLQEATANGGIAFQMLVDRPDLAVNVDYFSINGRKDRGYPIHFYVTGGQAETDAWAGFLGVAAQVRVIESRKQWHATVSTRDVHVTITHPLEEVN